MVWDKIQIEWLTDVWGCDDCGGSFAQGAIVTFDGEVIVRLIPFAHCYDGDDYSETDVYKAILVELGYSVEEV